MPWTRVVRRRRKGQVIALKQVEHVMNEKNLLEQCDHPFLLNLAATFQDSDEIYMLLELALGGELFSVLRERIKFDEPTSRFYGACVASAFAYMHDKQIVYRDLKPENLLFDDAGYLRVCDFGFAKQIQVARPTLSPTFLPTFNSPTPLPSPSPSPSPCPHSVTLGNEIALCRNVESGLHPSPSL